MPSPTERHRFALATRIALAGAAVTGGAMLFAGTAAADPGVPDPQLPIVPVDPAAAPPGQPVVVVSPAGPRRRRRSRPRATGRSATGPGDAEPGYGGGQSGQTFGYPRDLWHASRSGDPLSALTVENGGSMAPPPAPGRRPSCRRVHVPDGPGIVDARRGLSVAQRAPPTPAARISRSTAARRRPGGTTSRRPIRRTAHPRRAPAAGIAQPASGARSLKDDRIAFRTCPRESPESGSPAGFAVTISASSPPNLRRLWEPTRSGWSRSSRRDYEGFGPGDWSRMPRRDSASSCATTPHSWRFAFVTDKEWAIHAMHLFGWMVPGEFKVVPPRRVGAGQGVAAG